jgi:hypothetical protein
MPLIGWNKLRLLVPYGRTHIKRLEDANDFPKRRLPFDPQLTEIVDKNGKPRTVGYLKAMWDLAEVMVWLRTTRAPSGELTPRPDESPEKLNAHLEAIIELERRVKADERQKRRLAELLAAVDASTRTDDEPRA